MLLPVRVIQITLWACVSGFCSELFAAESQTCRLEVPLYVVTCSETCSLSRLDSTGHARVLKQADSWRQFEPRYHRRPGSSSSDRWDTGGLSIDRRTTADMLDTPTAIATDRSRFAAANAPLNTFDEYEPKQEFVVLDGANGNPIWRRNVKGSVESLVWSPNGSAIAALISAPAEKPKRGFVDALAGVFGWSVEHRRAWLEVFDAEGVAQCELELYSDVKTPSTYVVWPVPP